MVPVAVYIIFILPMVIPPIVVESHILTICNCTKPIVKGIIDLKKPPYCKLPPSTLAREQVKYSVITKTKIWRWTGYACAQWIAQKEVSTDFLFAHDTIFKKSVVKVTPEACWKTIEVQHQCGTNTMTKDGTTYKFLHEPTGSGTWMTTQKFSVLNCFTQEIQLYRETKFGPIFSPFGEIHHVENNDHAIHNDLTIVWRKPDGEFPCETRIIHDGFGETITHTKLESRLIDKHDQLEFHFNKNFVKLCGEAPLNAVHGIPDIYLHIIPLSKKTRRSIPSNNALTVPKPTSGNSFSNADYDTELTTGIADQTANMSESMKMLQALRNLPYKHPLDLTPIEYYGLVRFKSDEQKTKMNQYCLLAYRGRLKLGWCFTDVQRQKPPTEYNMDFALLDNGALKTLYDHQCVDTDGAMKRCYDDDHENSFPIVEYDTATSQLRFSGKGIASLQCLTGSYDNHSVSLDLCIDNKPAQKWTFEHRVVGPKKNLFELPTEQEYRLAKITNVGSVDGAGFKINLYLDNYNNPSWSGGKGSARPRMGPGKKPPQLSFHISPTSSTTSTTTTTTTPTTTSSTRMTSTTVTTTTASTTPFTPEESDLVLQPLPTTSSTTPQQPEESDLTLIEEPTTTPDPLDRLPVLTEDEIIAANEEEKMQIQQRTQLTNPQSGRAITLEHYITAPATSNDAAQPTPTTTKRPPTTTTSPQHKTTRPTQTTTRPSVTTTQSKNQGTTDGSTNVHPSVDATKDQTDDEALFLTAEHKKYIDSKFNDNLNVLAEEIKDIYCQDVSIRQNQAFLLAQSNGLLAARALGLGICEHVESSGMTLILQQCAKDEITISAKETRCGYQPFFQDNQNKTFTIGKDGWSLHEFLDCFWSGPYVTFNDFTYTYVGGEWRIQRPDIHLTKLHLVNKFAELPINEYDFSPRHHHAYDMHSMEQLNVFSELLSRVQETNSDSLSDLVMDVQSKNNVWDLTGWMSYIKYGLLGLGLLIVVVIILRIMFIFKLAIGNSFRRMIPPTWRRRNTSGTDPNDPSMIPMLAAAILPGPSAPSAPLNIPHDHSDTLFVGGKLYWKDMCPIQPLTK